MVWVCVHEAWVGVSFVALRGVIVSVWFCVGDRVRQTQTERFREGEGQMERVRERLRISPGGVSNCHCTIPIVHILKKKKGRKKERKEKTR